MSLLRGGVCIGIVVASATCTGEDRGDISRIFQIAVTNDGKFDCSSEADVPLRVGAVADEPFYVRVLLNGNPVLMKRDSWAAVRTVNHWLKPGRNVVEIVGETRFNLAIILFSTSLSLEDTHVIGAIKATAGDTAGGPSKIEARWELHSSNSYLPPIYANSGNLPATWREDVERSARHALRVLGERDANGWRQVFGTALRTRGESLGKPKDVIEDEVGTVAELFARGNALTLDPGPLRFRRYSNTVAAYTREEGGVLFLGKEKMMLFGLADGVWIPYE